MSNEETPPPPKRAPAKTSRLAVVIIVLVLSALCLLWTLPLKVSRGSPAAQCRANLKQIGLAVGMYCHDHDEQMPADLQALVVDDHIYITRVNVFRCPSDPAPPVDAADVDASASYYYVRVTDPFNLKSASRVPIAWDKKLWCDPEGVNVLFADLHVANLRKADLEKRLQLYRNLYD